MGVPINGRRQGQLQRHHRGSSTSSRQRSSRLQSRVTLRLRDGGFPPTGSSCRSSEKHHTLQLLWKLNIFTLTVGGAEGFLVFTGLQLYP
ncbi:hypothetical protein GN956_G3740 [Arapaima gigas]